MPPDGIEDLSQNVFNVRHEAIQLREGVSFDALLRQDGAQTLADLDTLFTALARGAGQ